MTNNFETMMNAMMEQMMEKMQEKMMEAMMASMMKSFGAMTEASAEIEPEKAHPVSVDPKEFFSEKVKPSEVTTNKAYDYKGIELVVAGWKTHCFTKDGEKHFYKRVEVYFDRPVESSIYKLNLEQVKSKWNGNGCKRNVDNRTEYGFAFKTRDDAQKFFMSYQILTK